MESNDHVLTNILNNSLLLFWHAFVNQVFRKLFQMEACNEVPGVPPHQPAAREEPQMLGQGWSYPEPGSSTASKDLLSISEDAMVLFIFSSFPMNISQFSNYSHGNVWAFSVKKDSSKVYVSGPCYLLSF